MVLDNIEQLIEKYDNGETTLQEEQQLKHYFSQEETVMPHLEVYKPMFAYFLDTHKEQFTKDVPLKPRKTKALYKWISVAAVAVLMFGAYNQIYNPPIIDDFSSLTQEEQETYTNAVKVFSLMSSKFDKGTESMNALASNFTKGANNLTYVNEFSETTNKFLKTTSN
ncbi:hypothetical protein D7030_09495 [Flavobacteriaceae bacterium AU392]|nr:hypothetical protein D1817_07320 [Flavobacteriaceae bacterium]RKM83521.1 hypothetical protein D7030_09495 [Flavobacteriaceae bacterium AU392]